MKPRASSVAASLTVLLLGGANVALAVRAVGEHREAQEAQWWGTWHWDRNELTFYRFGEARLEQLQAIGDWNAYTPVSFKSLSTHADLSIFDSDWGETSWAGLATIKNYASDDHGGRIDHCHARVNRHYVNNSGSSWYWRGVYCQEIGHCLGLGHDFTRGCMDTGAVNWGVSNRPSSAELRAIEDKYSDAAIRRRQ